MAPRRCFFRFKGSDPQTRRPWKRKALASAVALDSCEEGHGAPLARQGALQAKKTWCFVPPAQKKDNNNKYSKIPNKQIDMVMLWCFLSVDPRKWCCSSCCFFETTKTGAPSNKNTDPREDSVPYQVYHKKSEWVLETPEMSRVCRNNCGSVDLIVLPSKSPPQVVWNKVNVLRCRLPWNPIHHKEEMDPLLGSVFLANGITPM